MLSNLCRLACKPLHHTTVVGGAASVQVTAVRHLTELEHARRQRILSEPDDNDLALEQLDPSLLKPYPEYRQAAAGTILHKDFYDRVWGPWKKIHVMSKRTKPYDDMWAEYEEKFECSPTEYFNTKEFEETYKGQLVWWNYVRRHKGGTQPQKTRTNCYRNGIIHHPLSPCPLCRDERLLISYKNIPLLNQFIDQPTGEIFHVLRTGNCRTKQKLLENAVQLAKELGYLENKVQRKKIGPYELKTHYTFAV